MDDATKLNIAILQETDSRISSMVNAYNELSKWEDSVLSGYTNISPFNIGCSFISRLSENIYTALRNYLELNYNMDLTKSRQAATFLTTQLEQK